MAKLQRVFEVAEYPPPYVIVTVDASRGDAHALVDAAADAGSDAVQIVATSLAALGDLRGHIAERGLDLLVPVADLDGLARAVDLEVPALLLHPPELTDRALLEAAAGCGRPVICSTATGVDEDITAAVERLDPAPHLALMHGASPGTAAANVRAIVTLHSKFGIPVGWSGADPDETLAAVALGAAIVELSADRPDFADTVDRVRGVHAAVGDGRLPLRHEGSV